ncbi:MAG: hypothetical protein U0790_02550 [Isosphaeraceae bacterium]
MSDANQDEKFLRHLSRHLVSLGCVHAPASAADPNEEKWFFTSGFVMEVRGVWFLVTAGHVLEDISKQMTRHPDRRYRFMIADSFGDKADYPDPIPIDYTGTPKHFVYDENGGMDFGLMLLNDNCRQLLERNKVEPLREAKLRPSDDLECFMYCMIGFPNQSMAIERPGHLRLEVDLIPLERLTTAPGALFRQTAPMFYGKISRLPDGYSIKGMSGCPILGFAKHGEDIRYHFIAVQSGWLPDSKIIYAGMVSDLAGMLGEAIDRAASG